MHVSFLFLMLQCIDIVSIAAWDVDFATTAYRQQVEALAKKQVSLYLKFLCVPLVHSTTSINGFRAVIPAVVGRTGKASS